MAGDQDVMSKLPKLAGAKNFIPWRQRMRAYILSGDNDLLGLSELPGNATTAQQRAWRKAMLRAKTSIILTLEAGPLAQTTAIVDDDDKSAKDLWESLESLYTASNEQTVINLMQELERLEYQDGGNWESHLNKFHEILGKLASLGKQISDEEKVSKLIRTLSDHFSPLAMVSSKMSYDELVNAVETEISRCNMKKIERSKGSVNVPKASMAGGRKFGTRSGRIEKNRNGNEEDVCWICGRNNHHSRDCFHRADKLAKQGLPPFRGRGRGRGGFRGGNRGRPFYRGRGGGPSHYGYNQSHQYPTAQNYPQIRSNQGGYQGGWYAPTQQMGQSSQNPSGQAVRIDENQPPPPPGSMNHSNHTHQNPPYGFMAHVKFRSAVAKCSEEKTTSSLIDSGGSHHFFYSKKSFFDYEPIDQVDVQAASEMSVIVGRGRVIIPLDGGLLVEAYHAPHFQANILSVGLLTKRFNILFTADPPAQSNHSTCIISKRRTKDIIKMVEVGIDGLYKLECSTQQSSHRASSIWRVSEVVLPERSCAICKQTFKTSMKTQQERALEWHSRTGHPHPSRYLKLSQAVEDVEISPKKMLENVLCIPCSIGKAQRGPILPSMRLTRFPLELVHVDITGKMSTSSLGGSHYAVGFVDDYTAKTDVHFISKKSDILPSLKYYKERSEHLTARPLINIRLDGAGENMASSVVEFCLMNGIRLEPSPPYAPQSNGVAERFMQELGTRARVLLFGGKLQGTLWAEAMSHGNWLRNRLPSSRIDDNIPIRLWDINAMVSFQNLPVFGQQGFAFIYRPQTQSNRKLSPRAVHGNFVGMESEATLFRIYVPTWNKVIVTRKQDFRMCQDEQLPGVSALLDGISRQIEMEHQERREGSAEELLTQAFYAYRFPLLQSLPQVHSARHNLRDTRLPRSFREAISNKLWCTAIDREYHALKQRKTWEYVPFSNELHVIPFTWVFRLKPLDALGKTNLYKARCVVRGDMHSPGFEFDPDKLYAPVASHESIRMILAIAAADGLMVEGGDVCNAYLHGDISIPIFIEQPTDSTGVQERPGFVCKLLRSMYGLKQAGEIWGSMLVTTILTWNFKQSTVDARVFFRRVGNEFVIIVIVVDDMKFVSNSVGLLEHLRFRLGSTFDVKFFGKLKSFVGWEIDQGPTGIRICQHRYTEDLLSKHGLREANGTWTPLPINADLTSAHEHDTPVSKSGHANYRATIGALLYLAVCTRPDISFAVGVLARQVHAPTARHVELLKRVLRYLSGTRTLGIKYERRTATGGVVGLQSFADSDWAGDPENRKSTTGYVVTLHGAPVSWKSQKQKIVALSSAEAEYVALSTCAKNLQWIRRLHYELTNVSTFDEDVKLPSTILSTDNTAAMSLAVSEQVSAKSKHIGIKYHYVRELVKNGTLRLSYVQTFHQVADILTKAVERRTLERHRASLLN